MNDHRSHHFTDLVGQTPLLLLTSFSTDQVQFFAKLEGYNPGSSLYDRLALSLIERAERSLGLKPDSLLIDDSSSELSVSLAMMGAAKGYSVHCVVSPQLHAKTRQLILAYGASIEEVPTTQARTKHVTDLMNIHPNAYWISDYRNVQNLTTYDSHVDSASVSLANEILQALDGQVDMCVFPLSAGPLLIDCARFLKQNNADIHILAVDDRHERQEAIPVLPFVDDVVTVEEADQLVMCKELLHGESLLTGPASGAVMHAAKEALHLLSMSTSTPVRIAAILPDHGDRYLKWLNGERIVEPAVYIVG